MINRVLALKSQYPKKTTYYAIIKGLFKKKKPILHTSPNGKPLSNEQLKDIAAIKKMLPKQWTFKNIVKLYFRGKFDVETTKKRPLNNMVAEVEGYAKKTSNISFNIIQNGIVLSMSLKALILILTEKSSEKWRESTRLKKNSITTLIPVIEVTYLLEAMTKIAKIITLNFDKIAFL